MVKAIYLAAFWIFSPPRSMSLPTPLMVLQAAKFRAKAAAMVISKKRMEQLLEKKKQGEKIEK
jgi:hypothetical protein